MPDDASDRTRMRARPGHSRPSATPRRRDGAPLAGAPGWYVVRRKSRIPLLFDRLLRRRPHFGLVAIAAAAGVAVLVLSLVRAHWGEAPAERSTTILMPPVASSPGAGPGEPPAAAAEAPAPGPTSEPDPPIEEPGGSQGASATAAARAKADPAPPESSAALLLASRQAPDRLIPEWQSRPRPLASAAPSQSPVGGTPSRAPVSRTVSPQPSPSSPQAAARPARPGLAAEPQVAGEVSSSEDRPALPAGEIRVFIHHVADHHGDAALAQRLADHLQRQGFTVADIRPVDFSIDKPSVRYFFARDRAASRRLVDELGRFFEERTSAVPDDAIDFTHFVPKPRPGNVEVWLPAS
jgi:hypothetical protein